MRKIRMYLRKLEHTLENGFDLIYDDTLMAVGAFVVNVFTISVTLWYAITNMMPIIPQWAWAAMFAVTLIVGTFQLEGLVYPEDDEMGDEEPEDDEIVED